MACTTDNNRVFHKDPNATLWYGITWADYLEEIDSDTIASSDWILPDGADIVIEDEATENEITKVKLSGGTLGEIYDVVNRIVTTASDETEDRSIRIIITQR